MASKAALASLPSPLRDLVAAATPNEQDYGTTDQDKAEVKDWISKVAEGEIVKPSSSEKLNTILTPKTYIVGNTFTAADVALYGALHPTLVRSLLPKKATRSDPMYSHNYNLHNITRIPPSHDTSTIFKPDPLYEKQQMVSRLLSLR